ncbi:hydroxysteroid dehydrogenase-like protein 1 [Cloeon dipterum]|uniref:hydroxysteroid dehydrogenase-like protein 1 n=1 Tax=Cloeon dipterum TaxID=197152 RepID=UPI00321FBD06
MDLHLLSSLYSLVAFFCVARLVLSVISIWTKISYKYALSKWIFQQKDLVKKYGSWAVVTGSSDGIGKSLAKELAKRGMNIVLISNEEEKLKSVSADIESECSVQTIVIYADFSKTEEEYEKIFTVIDGLDVGILVNNAGTACGLPYLFENMSRQQIWTMMLVNMGAATALTHYILPKMISKGKGLIANMASTSSFAPTPYASLYAASKTFILSFSESLRHELKGTGVDVQVIHPFFVDTRVAENSKAPTLPKVLYPSADKYARSLSTMIGEDNITAGYLPHQIQFAISQSLPRCVQIWMAADFMAVRDFRKEQQSRKDR